MCRSKPFGVRLWVPRGTWYEILVGFHGSSAGWGKEDDLAEVTVYEPRSIKSIVAEEDALAGRISDILEFRLLSR